MGIMVLIGIAVARLHNLFAVIMLTGIFSLTAAVLYVLMDAVDVAFTEAAVGAGISTVLVMWRRNETLYQESPQNVQDALGRDLARHSVSSSHSFQL